MSSEYQHTVNVWGEPCVVAIYQISRRGWVVVGEYAGKRIEAKGLGKNAALAAWREAARLQGPAAG
jgi:hypothetical protein